MAKRITNERVKKWAISSSIVGVPTAILIIGLMLNLGVIDVTGYSENSLCTGTEEVPCYIYINFTVKEDIFIYPSDNWSLTGFESDPQPKEVKMYRSWGKSWRQIKLDQSCTGTWCGLSNSDDTRIFSFAFREGRDYQIRFSIIKSDPEQDIKWGFGLNE